MPNLDSKTVDAMERERGERPSPFEAHVRQELADIKAMLAKLSGPTQVRHARDLT